MFFLMYDYDYNWRAKCNHYKIKEMDDKVWEVWVIGGGLWLLFLIVIWTVLTLYDLYVIVTNDGVYVIDKKNVLCWGPMET